MAKGLMDENQQPSVRQELERLFFSTRGGGRRVESRELYWFGAGELCASTATNKNTSFAALSTTKWMAAEV